MRHGLITFSPACASPRACGRPRLLLNPADALAVTADSDLTFLESRPYGGAYVLDDLAT